MILEIAQIDVKPGMEAEFEAGVSNAAPLFRRAKGCISMALQSACLLCELLMVSRYPATSDEWKCIAGDYERAYRSRFALRIRAASLFAMLAMRPRISATAAEVLAAAPQLLELGARWAGKAQPLRV